MSSLLELGPVSELVAGALALLLWFIIVEGALEDKPSEVEKAKDAYERGEISIDELDRRVELALDEEATRIREAVEPVNAVGPATSASIEEYYDTLEELRQASLEELEEIHGIGPSTAKAVKQRLTHR